MIADAEFALLQSEGQFGVAVAYYDLFRVAGGKIVEQLGRQRPDSAEPAPRQRPVLNAMSHLTYAGRRFRLSVDNGVVFENTYSDDGTRLQYETVAGPSAGAHEDVQLPAAEVAPGVFIVGWVEASGMTVIHAMNLTASTVHVFWTYDAGDERVAELHTATLEPA